MPMEKSVSPIPESVLKVAINPVPHLSRSIRGESVLVTGAGSGMGRSTAFVFAREGARVAVTDVNANAADRVAADIIAEGGDACAWRFDVSDVPTIGTLVHEIGNAMNGIDILINN